MHKNMELDVDGGFNMTKNVMFTWGGTEYSLQVLNMYTNITFTESQTYTQAHTYTVQYTDNRYMHILLPPPTVCCMVFVYGAYTHLYGVCIYIYICMYMI